ncbi:MAG TPA: threonine-phosphate decarboxylase CobD [Methylomusa anaerophila]|uniref:threonine-phosphate decarboxylase n=1 Tax=Methylomusa anaerophila TaxID=1930071 RepID=A0A348AQD3_9FIRM|nr:threonine-phosphate decarboxylase CobD [Methylomusa anaerophila]BBB93281.1 threonine-phosphate decarboxylase [Methylomusa anaerophila]HML86888.1 threonine-phosphate decarboxylase CobD [Methylomusa anaerophila]
MDMRSGAKADNFRHGGNVYALARGKGGVLAELLDYSANINPLGLADSVQDAINQSIHNIIHYPDADAYELKRSISNFYNVEAARITMGNGAVELLYILCHITKPGRVLIPAPSFSEYERASRAAGAKIQYYMLSAANGFVFDVEKISAELDGADILFFGNPNNPTGTLIARTEIAFMLRKAREYNTLVVVDESFMDFITDDSLYTSRSLLKEYPNLIIIHSLTKFYAIPGLRLGFALTAPDLAARLQAAKDPWNVNTLAQAAGVAALADRDYQAKSKEIVNQAKKELFSGLTELPGCRPYPPAANYVLVNIEQTGITAAKLCSKMAERKILIRDCSNYPGLSQDYIRVAVKLPATNKILLDTLRQVITGGAL